MLLSAFFIQIHGADERCVLFVLRTNMVKYFADKNWSTFLQGHPVWLGLRAHHKEFSDSNQGRLPGGGDFSYAQKNIGKVSSESG